MSGSVCEESQLLKVMGGAGTDPLTRVHSSSAGGNMPLMLRWGQLRCPRPPWEVTGCRHRDRGPAKGVGRRSSVGMVGASLLPRGVGELRGQDRHANPAGGNGVQRKQVRR